MTKERQQRNKAPEAIYLGTSLSMYNPTTLYTLLLTKNLLSNKITFCVNSGTPEGTPFIFKIAKLNLHKNTGSVLIIFLK